MDYFIKDFDEKWLPKLEKASEIAIPSATLLYALYDPQIAEHIMEEHPIYISGMTGAYFGGLVGAKQDLNKRKVRKALEETIED